MVKRKKGDSRKTIDLRRAPLVETLDDSCLKEYLERYPEDVEMVKNFPEYSNKSNKIRLL